MASVAIWRIDLWHSSIFKAVFRSRLGRQFDQIFYLPSPRVEFRRVVIVPIPLMKRPHAAVDCWGLGGGFVKSFTRSPAAQVVSAQRGTVRK